jgi:sigma-B regulation protein RsbU (phosphoserine phosphatase)
VLEEGDVAVFVTDGLTECQAHRGRFLDTETCLDVVRSRLDASASEILGGLHDLVRGFSGDDPQSDDITIVVCKASAKAEDHPSSSEGESRATLQAGGTPV